MLPKTIIKHIIKYLIHDFLNFKNYLYISKEYYNYILSSIKYLIIKHNEHFKLISAIKINNQLLKDNIKKIIICGRLFTDGTLSVEDLSLFPNLKVVEFYFTSTNSLNFKHTGLLANINKKYEIKINSSQWFPFSNEDLSNFRKLKYTSSSPIFYDSLNKLLESSIGKLKTLDVSISTFFYSIDPLTLVEFDINQDEEREEAISNAIKFSKLLNESNSYLKTLSLRDPNVYIEKIPNYESTHLAELYGIQIKSNQLFQSLSNSRSLRIQKLKLVSTNLNQSDIYNEFIQYLLNHGYNSLIQLSIRDNLINEDNQNLNNNDPQFINFIQKSNKLSKLDISSNSFNQLEIFNEIINNLKYQYYIIKTSTINKSLLNLLIESNYLNYTNIKIINNNHNESILINHEYLIDNLNKEIK